MYLGNWLHKIFWLKTEIYWLQDKFKLSYEKRRYSRHIKASKHEKAARIQRDLKYLKSKKK